MKTKTKIIEDKECTNFYGKKCQKNIQNRIVCHW